MQTINLGRGILKLIGVGLLAVVSIAWLTTPAAAAVYYLGTFTGSTPKDDPSCGTGKGTAPSPHPCATLAYWTLNRRTILTSGDTVRLTGTFANCAGAGCTNHCIVTAYNVTYEGRNADDTVADDYDSAIVDGVNVPAGNQGNCGGRIFTNTYPAPSQLNDFSRFTLRDMTVTRGQREPSGYAASQLLPGPPGSGYGCTGGTCDRLVIDRVRFTDNPNLGGLHVGKCITEDGAPCTDGYGVTNLNVVDSQVDNVQFKGLMLCCVDGFTVERTDVFNVLDVGCDPQAPDCSIGGPCDDRVGIHVGSRNGVIRDCEVYGNGQSNIDTGSVAVDFCDPAANTNVYERNIVHDALCGSNMGFGHCTFGITVRNNIIYGSGTGFNQKACANNLKVYNNTYWMKPGTQAVHLDENCRGCDFRNNIIRCDRSGECVHADYASTSPETIWQNNIILNENTTNGALAIAERAGACVPGNPTCNSNLCKFGGPYNPGLPAGWNSPATDNTLTDGQLSGFKTGGDAGQWFGAESGDTDAWGQTPALVAAAQPSATNLALSAVDTVAKDKGQVIASFSVDHWGQSRPQGTAWDIGADEVGSSSVTAPSLISVIPVP